MKGYACLIYLNVSMFLVATIYGVYLQGTGESFMQYPHWHACQNASLSFDLSTLVPDALLLYSDDGGNFAFVSILLKSGQVSVKLNFVQDPDHHAVHLHVNRTVNDGLWHTVLLRRNRMETILAVDGVSDSRYALGASDEHFGNSPTDSFVYIGGLPVSYWQHMKRLTVPSTIYAQRLNGHVRNVIYNNCTCMRLRAGQPLTGEGIAVMTSDLACDTERHNCSRGCLCLTTDVDYACDCSERACIADVVSHYEIPMDVAMFDGTIANPSSLNVMVINSVAILVPGLNGLAAQIGFNNSYIIVDTVPLKSDCFGDFEKCHMGFTVMLSLKMLVCSINQEVVILSTDLNMNMSVMNLVYTSISSLTFCYHRISGQPLCVSCHDVATDHWHQIAVTWHPVTGLAVYLNGHLASSVGTIQNSLRSTDYKQLYLGHPNNTCQFLVDNVNFWSRAVNHTEVRELGVLVCIALSMELKNTSFITESGFKMIVHGHPKQVDGKVGKAIMFETVNQFLVSDDDQELQCLVNLIHCQHGLMISAWLFWTQLNNASHYYDSGCRGLQMFATNQQITVVATAGFQQWTVSWSSVTVNHWYFVEISWSIEDGLEMHIDHKLIASSQVVKTVSDRDLDSSKRLYIGRSSRPNSQQPLISGFILDELHICYGSIRILTTFGFLHRGRPCHYIFNMDTIHGDLMPHSSLSIRVHGNGIAKPITVPGKINNATRLDGDSQFIVIDGLNDSCLPHLLSCSQHGYLISTWLKFRRLDNGMYYLSTGDGIKIFYGEGHLVFETSVHNMKWEVMVYGIQLETWYFTEVTWTAKTGLFVYINGHLSGQQTEPTHTTPRNSTGHLLIGYADDVDPLQPVHFADFIIDQTEIWLQDRNTLIAFNYIARGNITHLMMSFDELQTEENLVVKFSNGASLVSGRQNNSLQLISGQSANIESMKGGPSCLSDIHLYSCGIMISFHVFITDMTQSIPLLTSDSIKVQALSNGHLEVHFVKDKMHWLAVTQSQTINANNWHHIELSWHEDKGIQVFIDKTCKASTIDGIETDLSTDPSFNCSLHVGWLNDNTTQISSTVLIDDIEVWFADRDHLQAFGFLEDDVNYVLLDMEQISNDLLTHPTHVIYVHGSPRTVPSQHGSGVLLNGLNQYLDAGKDIACKNNLNNCPKGFTLRFRIKPYQLADLTYFISSAPIDVYYKNCLIAEVRTPNKQWRVSSVDFETHSWQQVDVSWHSADGLVLFINGKMVDKDTKYATNEVDYNSSWRFLIGRANSDMRRENFANAVFDDVEFWETTRQVILMMGFIKDLNEMNMNQSTVSRKRSVLTTPATVRPVQYLHGNHITATAISYYVQIPTGRPIRNITANGQNVILPTLPPSMKKKLVFDSSAFIKYDLSKLPQNYQTTNLFQQMYVKFQTVESNGLLWHSGNDQQCINLSLKNGALLLAVYYGEGKKSDKFKIATNQRLDDNEWHDVYLTLRHKQITVMVDDMEFPKSLMAEIQLMSVDGSLYVAGSDNTALLTHDNMRNNFRGTIDKVVLTGDSLPSDINFFDLTLIKPTPEYVEIYGLYWR